MKRKIEEVEMTLEEESHFKEEEGEPLPFTDEEKLDLAWNLMDDAVQCASYIGQKYGDKTLLRIQKDIEKEIERNKITLNLALDEDIVDNIEYMLFELFEYAETNQVEATDIRDFFKAIANDCYNIIREQEGY